MEPLQFTAEGDLEILPSPGSSKKDFDFFPGKWQVKNRKLKTRLEGCMEWLEFDATNEDRSVLHGLGNVDHFKASFDNIPFEGLTVRLFDPTTKLWSIYWADSNAGILDVAQVGSFEKNIGHFYSRGRHGEKEVIVVFKWDKTDVNNPSWSQAFSADNGKTWEWNWYMYMTRVV